jgi:hypothetical protein
MHFTLAGILALATAVAATPVAPPVWHATPDIDVTQLEQRCGDLNVYCCNNFGNGNGNSGLAAAGLTEEIITALGGALGFIPGANTACAPANVNSGAITETVTGTLAGLLGLREYILYPEQYVLFTYMLSEQPRRRKTFAAVK